MKTISDFIKYPIYHNSRFHDKIALKTRYSCGYCPICNNLTVFRVNSSSLRETLECRICKSTNRQRQLIYVTLESIYRITGNRLKSLKHIDQIDNINIYNTETAGAIHDALLKHKT